VVGIRKAVRWGVAAEKSPFAKVFIREVVELGTTILEPESLIREEKEGFIFFPL